MVDEKQTDLRRALERDEIVPFFQPLVELRTGLLTGFEVLARWRHPQRGIIHPDEFIPLAEESGTIGLLSENLLRNAFAAATVLPGHLTLSVNISLAQLTDRSLPRHIRQAAQQGQFPLHRLILEITESALIGNPELAYLIANELKEQGSRLALADFGTGYSSLRHHRPRQQPRPPHRSRGSRRSDPRRHAPLARLRSRTGLSLWPPRLSRRPAQPPRREIGIAIAGPTL